MEIKQNINLISLVSQTEADAVDFMEENEEYHEYIQYLDEELCRELKISNINQKFLSYGWNGFFDELPWDCGHNVPFNPQKINVIIPTLSSVMSIRGNNRKIVLTYPKMFRNQQPFYAISVANENQAKNIKVLPPLIRPFAGIEAILKEGGFERLEEFRSDSYKGIIFPCNGEIIIPSKSLNYF